MSENMGEWLKGAVAVIAVVVFFYVFIVYGIMIPYAERTGCVNAGYAGTIGYNDKTYCVRIVDGNLDAVPYTRISK